MDAHGPAAAAVHQDILVIQHSMHRHSRTLDRPARQHSRIGNGTQGREVEHRALGNVGVRLGSDGVARPGVLIIVDPGRPAIIISVTTTSDEGGGAECAEEEVGLDNWEFHNDS
jgi:hypothetical protein